MDLLTAKLNALTQMRERLHLLEDSQARTRARKDWTASDRLEAEHAAMQDACERALDALCEWLRP